jgi:hypothetical protein
VAPVKLGKGAVTGAGSVITTDVPAGALAVERSEQRVVKGYRKRRDAEAETGKKRGTRVQRTGDTEARAGGSGGSRSERDSASGSPPIRKGKGAH